MRLNHLCIVSFILATTLACVDDATPGTDAPGGEDASILDAQPRILDGSTTEDAGETGCTSDEMCEAGSQCVDGMCTEPGCRDDDECEGAFQVCREGECRQRCLGDGMCPDNGFCVDNVCVPPDCMADGDCDGDTLCREGRCVEALPCASTEECSDDRRCIDGNCEPRQPCAGDRMCAADEICDEGLCREQDACEGADDCAEREDCVGGRCVPAICRGDVDCPDGEVCLGGECLDPPSPEVERVIILNRARTTTIGQPIEFRAIGLDVRGDIVTSQGFRWTSSDEDVIVIDAENGRAVAGPMTGEAQITATWANEAPIDPVVSEPVAMRVIETMPDENIRVTLVDAIDGSPVVGAVVRVGAEERTTDDAGQAALPGPEGLWTMSVFSQGHNYVSLVNDQPGEFLLPLPPRSRLGRIAGFSGQIDFDRVTTQGEVDLTLSGASFGRGLTQLDFETLIGDIFNVNVNAGFAQVDLPIPGGVTLAADAPIIGALDIKDTYYALTDEGFRLAWSFAGRISIGEILAFAGGDFDVGQVLTTLFPFLENFEHGLRVAGDLQALPRVQDEDDIDGDGDRDEMVPDYERFQALNVEPARSQGLRVNVEVPEPMADGEVALIFSGVELEQVGFVPLGVSAADEPGSVATRMTPPYDGLEAGRPVSVLVRGEFGGDSVLPEDVSILINRYADRVPEDVVFADGFVPVPTGTEWDPVMRSFGAEETEGADFHRALFAGESGSWVVYFAPGLPFELSMPFPPDGYPDFAASSELRFEALRLVEGVGLSDLLSPGGPGDLADLDALARGVGRKVQ